MRKKIAVLLSVVLLAMLPGCTDQQIITAISTGVPPLIDGSLVHEAATSPVTANAIASTISSVITTDCLPLLNGNLTAGQLLVQLQTIIETKTGNGFGSAIAGVLGMIFQNVNVKLPTSITARELTFVNAGLVALKSGCDQFLAGKVAMLDGSQVDRDELVACLHLNASPGSMSDATPKVPAPEWSYQTTPVSTCRNGQCNRGSSCTRCSRGAVMVGGDMEWDAEGVDGNGQGCYRQHRY